MVVALAYLRDNGILHRDLKPGNIILDKNYHLKLVDFGTCKVFNKELKAKIEAHQNRAVRNGKQGGKDD